MTTVAAVDIGTNSVKITVGQRDGGGGLRVLHDATEITRLGKKVDAAGRLAPEAVEKTLAALETFGKAAHDLGAEKVAAVGTSALRDAANGAEFVREAERLLGGTVEVISGDREAHLIYLAARRDPEIARAVPADALLATSDIGGGSTEIVLGRGDAVRFRDSLQLGAVRLTERTLPSDPPTPDEIAAATRMADEVLTAVPAPQPGETAVLVASGGTAANLAGMERGGLSADLHAARLTRARIEARIVSLASVPLAERRNIPGLEPDRADVILAGAIIQSRVLHRLGADALFVSLRGLRYGLLYELLGE
ncbi:MAG TPA: hypothetical protein VM490_24570 [Armatimonadaceae bacterium]|nr:hypothetical protein [Armatimonadaceae bacterium]